MDKTTNEEVCKTLARLTKRWPHIRVMQLISNAVPLEVHNMVNHDLYFVEDEALMGYLLAYEKEIDSSVLRSGTIGER